MSGLRSISNVAGLITIATQICSAGYDPEWFREVLEPGPGEFKIIKEILEDLDILKMRTEYTWVGLNRFEKETWEWHPDFYRKNT